MLENDLVLTRFLDACGDSLSDDDLPDNALWDVIAGRVEPERAHAAFVARLRAL